MTDIVLRRFGAEKDDAETLEDTVAVLRYLTESYDRMCRAGMSAKLYLPLLEAHARLSGIKPYGEDETADFEECFYRAQKARRRCFPDDCADLREALSGAIPEERIDELSRAAEETCRSSIKYDSVEMTEEYLAVIDEVEAEIDRLKTSDFCLEYWSLKSSLLAERGIVWQSPAQLNPNVMFD